MNNQDLAPRRLRCFAERIDGKWEAICVDLDIATEGRDLDEVKHRLMAMCCDYVDHVLTLDPVNRHRLLHRRSPLGLRLKYEAIHLLLKLLHRPARVSDRRAGFELPCPA
jgi:hypothetical protein